MPAPHPRLDSMMRDVKIMGGIVIAHTVGLPRLSHSPPTYRVAARLGERLGSLSRA